MNYNNRYIVELAKATILDIDPIKPKQEVDWKYIYNKSVEQNITGLLFCSVKKLDTALQLSNNLLDIWNKTMLTTFSLNTQRYGEFLKINKLVSDKNIKYIGLKGCILRTLYPVPELRTMGDFDILVYPDDVKKIKEIFVSKGYSVQNDAFGIVCKKGNCYWEIFTTIEEEMRVEPQKWDKLFFENIVCENGILHPTPTYFLIHLIVHTGKHCLREGSGIRNLCDIALYINKYKSDIDFETVSTACKEQKVWNIYVYIMNAVKQFFDVDISESNVPKKDSEQFVEYMMLNGVFGKQGNAIVPQAAKHEDDSIGGLRKILFPTVKMLDYRYKYLKKFPFLLPIAWIHRMFSAIFKWKYSFKQMAGDLKEAVEFSEEREKWINKLKLKDANKIN